MKFAELVGDAMRQKKDRDIVALFTNWPKTEVKPLKPHGYSRRRRILELRRTQYHQWRMGWGKPSKKS